MIQVNLSSPSRRYKTHSASNDNKVHRVTTKKNVFLQKKCPFLVHTQGNSLPIRAKAKNAQEREGEGRASRERGKLRGRSRGRGEG
jgi:hypothetical protein